MLVVVTGEFGRTPKIEHDRSTGAGDASAPAGTIQPGRDHWPRAFSNLWAGGGIRTGGVIGASDKRGEDVVERACGPGDFLATIYHHLGIDYSNVTINDFNNRPTFIVNDGKPIPELTAQAFGSHEPSIHPHLPAAAGSAIVSLAVSGPRGPSPTGRLNFVNDVVPILTKAGCNSGGCHAKAGSGQNGFRLSLLGFEPQEDYEHIVKEGHGRRVFPGSPEQSLLLLKASNTMPHGGGTRLDHESEGYQHAGRVDPPGHALCQRVRSASSYRSRCSRSAARWPQEPAAAQGAGPLFGRQHAGRDAGRPFTSRPTRAWPKSTRPAW